MNTLQFVICGFGSRPVALIHRFPVQEFHRDTHQAERLLTSACQAFHSAEETLDGLERDVEQAAAKCWAFRDKPVQVCVSVVPVIPMERLSPLYGQS